MKSTRCWRCSPTLPATCIWATCAITQSATWWLALSICRVIMCCTRWAGIPLACRRKMRPSNTAFFRGIGRSPISTICAASCKAWASATTGTVKWPPAYRNIINGRNGCFYSFTSTAWPTKSMPPSTGAPPAPRCWLMSRWWTAIANVATLWWRKRI